MHSGDEVMLCKYGNSYYCKDISKNVLHQVTKPNSFYTLSSVFLGGFKDIQVPSALEFHRIDHDTLI